MSNVLFVHDHRFLRGEDGLIYTSGSLPSRTWERYRGHFDDVTVLGRIADGEKTSGLALAEAKGVSFLNGPDLNSFGSLISPRSLSDRQIADLVDQHDAVIARLPSELGLRAARHARSTDKPYLVEVVGCPWDTYWNHGSIVGKFFAPLATQRMRREVSKSKLVIYVTAQWLQTRYHSRGLTTNASNVEVVAAGKADQGRRSARREAIMEGSSPVLGTVGSLRVRYKGIQDAIEAIALLRKRGIDLTYRVLGPGDPKLYQALARRRGVSDLVFFDGMRPAGAGVANWLDTIDVYLQPSYQEGLPRSTIEAMSRGCCCIGSTAGGIPELLPRSRLHKPGAIADLADIIENLIANPEAIADAGRRDEEESRSYQSHSIQQKRDVILDSLLAQVRSSSRA